MRKTILVAGGGPAAIHLLAAVAQASENRKIDVGEVVLVDPALHPEGGSPHSDPSPALRVNMRTELHDISGQIRFKQFLAEFGGAETEPPLRADLGRYCAHVKQAAVKKLERKGIGVRSVRDEVVGLEGNAVDGFQFRCRSGRTERGWRVVLATGNPPPKLPANVKVEESAAWRVSCYNGSTEFARLIRPEDAVVVVGTGPSGIDIARHLIEVEGHQAPITLVSRTGTLSAVQLEGTAPQSLRDELRDTLAHLRGGKITRLEMLKVFEPIFADFDPNFDLGALAGTPPDALADLEQKIEEAAKDEPRWRLAVDVFGQLAPEIWGAMDEFARIQFASNSGMVRAYYTNRHAMQAATARWQVSVMKTGQVRVGAIGEGGIEVGEGGVCCTATLLPGGEANLKAGHLVVATGPEYRLSVSQNPLIRQMLDEGLAEPYRLGNLEIGGFRTQGLELAGLPGVFAMGALVRGEYYAVHSFPALGRHAKTIVDTLLK
jgi:uncharacterized NAD(P)/FAD-binding protein YdhS